MKHLIPPLMFFLLLASCGQEIDHDRLDSYHARTRVPGSDAMFTPRAEGPDVVGMYLVSVDPEGMMTFAVQTQKLSSFLHLDFVLRHDPAVMRFVDAQVVPADGHHATSEAEVAGYETDMGEVFFEACRQHDEAVSNVLVYLRYDIIGQGDGLLDFTQVTALAQDHRSIDLPWAGGQVRVQGP